MQEGGVKVTLRTVYLHPGPSLRRLILCSKALVNNGIHSKGWKTEFTFQELEGGHCTI